MQVFFHLSLFWVQACGCSSSMALFTDQLSHKQTVTEETTLYAGKCTASRINHSVTDAHIAFENTSDQPFLMSFPFKIRCVNNYRGFQRNCLQVYNVYSQMNSMEQYIFAVRHVKNVMVCSEQTCILTWVKMAMVLLIILEALIF